MKLSELQLEEIRAFISKRGIIYLDVQMEILDHVASGVEERMVKNATLSFEDALKQTHASFGIFGFGGVEDSIIDSMSKRYNRIFFENFSSFFGVKYILLVLFAGVLIYQGNKYYELLLLIVMLSVVLFIGVMLITQKNKKHNKFLSYRLSATYLSYIGSLGLVLNFIINHTAKGTFLGLDISYFLTSIVFIILVIYILSALKTIATGKKEGEILMEKYSLLDYNDKKPLSF